jgi:glycosyltransferase involved in cell wall biosynthesis
MSTLVSIITPCLNSVKTIEQTILSVLKQGYKNIQYIVIDGQSSDGTIEILERYSKLDSRIFFISEKDNSMTEALNRGINISKGDIIASLNSDDWYESNTIEKVVKHYQMTCFDCLMGNTRFISELNQTLYITKPWLAYWLPAWYFMGCFTPESSVFYSAKCVKDVGYFNEEIKYTQDFEYYLRVISKYEVLYLDEVLSNFSVSNAQYSNRLHEQMEAEVLSYIKYKFLRKTLGGTNFGSLLRVVLGIRAYSYKELIAHGLRFYKKNIPIIFNSYPGNG